MNSSNITFVLLFGAITIANGQSCLKQFVGGEWISHGDCVSDQTKEMILREIEKMALEEKRVKIEKDGGWRRSGNLYYKYFTDPRNYGSAARNCTDHGGRLAAKVLRDPVVVKYILDKYSGLNMWVGFDDIQSEKTWVWSDGGDMNTETTIWHPSEPNSYLGHNEDCGHILSSSKEKLLLNDESCDHSQNYICEIDLN